MIAASTAFMVSGTQSSPPCSTATLPASDPRKADCHSTRSFSDVSALSVPGTFRKPDGRDMLLKKPDRCSWIASLVSTAICAASKGLSPMSGWRGVCIRMWSMSRWGTMSVCVPESDCMTADICSP